VLHDVKISTAEIYGERIGGRDAPLLVGNLGEARMQTGEDNSDGSSSQAVDLRVAVVIDDGSTNSSSYNSDECT